MKTLTDWLHYLESLHPRPIELGLERVAAVLHHLPSALDKLILSGGIQSDALHPFSFLKSKKLHCPIVTVGGTNGKGSTCAMLAAILLQAGYQVGVYTSPHLLSFNERVSINGQPVSDQTWLDAFEAVELARKGISLTYFEFTTLAALVIFATTQLDIVILEVGLGGRLDAVNIMDADVALVTSVDIDHTDYLGHTREAIGFEKAGIFRKQHVAICADPHPPQSLIDFANGIGADLRLLGRDFSYRTDKQQWQFESSSLRLFGLAHPALRGAYQFMNASGALAVLDALSKHLPISAQSIREGFASVSLTGRFQVIPGRPITVLDVAHNPHGVKALRHNLDNMGFYPVTYAILGAMHDKDIAGMIDAIRDIVDYWCVTDLPSSRAASADFLSQCVLKGIDETSDGCKQVQCFTTPQAAYAFTRNHAAENDRIVVFGSFVTVGEICAFLNEQKNK